MLVSRCFYIQAITHIQINDNIDVLRQMKIKENIVSFLISINVCHTLIYVAMHQKCSSFTSYLNDANRSQHFLKCPVALIPLYMYSYIRSVWSIN